MPCVLRLLPVLFAILCVFPLFGMEPETIVREQTIYVPYEKIRKAFEKDGRGVFLPYDEFQKLWDASRKNGEKPQPVAAPLPAMIAETESVATVADDVVKVEAKIFIELFKDGWNEVPLRLADAAITKATLGDRSARILGEPGQGFRLLVEKKSRPEPGPVVPEEPGSTPPEEPGSTPPEEPGSQIPALGKRLELVLHYAKKIDKAPGRNSVSFEVPQSPISRWKFSIPESGVKVDFFPLIAASEEKTEEKKGTTVLAFVGPTPQVRIGWTPKTEGATGLDALTSVQLQQKLTVDEGVLRTEARFDYSISRSQIESLAIKAPNDWKVAGVFDPNVKKWSVSQGADAQTISVELFEPAKEKQTVQLELEKLRPQVVARENELQSAIAVPALESVGVGRQQGILVVRTADGLTSETVKSTGLLRMDLSELPETLRQNNVKWDAAYRLSSANYGLELSVVKVEPRITATSQVAVELSEEFLRLDMQTAFDIERTGVFKLQLDVPDGFEIRSVRGFQHGNIQPVQVDGFNLLAGTPASSDSSKTLTVNLSKKAFGQVGLAVRLERKLSEPDLLSPTGKTVDLSVAVPTVTKNTVELAKGELIVQAKSAFRLNPLKTEGVQSVSLQQITGTGNWRLGTSDAQLGFLFAEEKPSFDLRVERRKPQLTIREIQTVRVDDGSVKYGVKFFYNVMFSGIKSLRIDVPQSVSGRLNRIGGNWRESQLVPQPGAQEPGDIQEKAPGLAPGGIPPGYVAWEYSAETELLGSGVLELAWEDELKQLEIGKPLPLEIPRLIPFKPEPTDRVWGQIILSKSQSIDLGESKETKGLKPIDPQYDVAQADRIGDAAAAFEFHDDWSLQLIATRYKLEEVKRTSIERGLVRANLIFSKSGTEISAQALYRIRSVEQRLEVLMPLAAKINDARINGRNVVLESGGATDKYLIPLNSVPPDTPFTLEIRYEYIWSANVRLPMFFYESHGKTTPAVQLTNVVIFVPEDRIVVGYRPEWSKEFTFHRNAEVVNHKNLSSLLDEFGDRGRDDFPTSGVPYLFSTLTADLGNGIVLMITGKAIANVIPFCVLLLLGLASLFVGWKRRFQDAVSLLIIAVLFGFAWPTLAELWSSQSGVWWGFFVVALLWTLQAMGQGIAVLREHCKRLPKPEQKPDEKPVAEPAPQPTTEGGPENV